MVARGMRFSRECTPARALTVPFGVENGTVPIPNGGHGRTVGHGTTVVLPLIREALGHCRERAALSRGPDHSVLYTPRPAWMDRACPLSGAAWPTHHRGAEDRW